MKSDIVVLDITMPQLNGLEAARQILKALPEVQVLILSVHESEQLVREILEVGAHGYVLKTDAGHELAAAVQALRRRELYFTSKTARIALAGRGLPGPVHLLPGESLTAREREVLQLLAESQSNKEVAAVLDVSIKTVETHRGNIMHKLGLHSVAELVHYVILPGVLARDTIRDAQTELEKLVEFT